MSIISLETIDRSCHRQGCPSGNNKASLLKGRFGRIVDIMVKREYELNLPRITSQSILGLNRRRLGIVNMFTLLSTCTIFLCYTEQ